MNAIILRIELGNITPIPLHAIKITLRLIALSKIVNAVDILILEPTVTWDPSIIDGIIAVRRLHSNGLTSGQIGWMSL